VTKKEIRAIMRRNEPSMKRFYRMLVLTFILLALCIAWIHIQHGEADRKNLSLYDIHPTDEEINQKRIQLASVRETLTDTDCSEIDKELDVWLNATLEMQVAQDQVDDDNCDDHLDIVEGQQR
jgi:hypothetical protein